MDIEMVIAMRKTRHTYRTAWGLKGQTRGLPTELPADTHTGSSNVVILATYRQGVVR